MTGLRWGVGLSGWVTLALTALPDASPLRVAATVVFLCVCPGLAATLLVKRDAFTRRAGRTDLLESAVLAGAVSVAVSALVAEVLFLGEVFTPTRALLVLATLTSALTIAPSVRFRTS
ncbi:hypothetical protein Stsp02_57220 [Streptomyces sp. NBRC 14336]|uniref:hypothetical protein n=1 Tax=Streptomyces sp. NBRC 14336 TaxID=3030992 RepID=UPI0024A5FD59|nr:hypothetical protein [Streptomyces sp. NBRC 14336]GLW50061.1 hypothetical protein Stsp02_57220 [Streptomyces sp. NBRC 14336]